MLQRTDESDKKRRRRRQIFQAQILPQLHISFGPFLTPFFFVVISPRTGERAQIVNNEGNAIDITLITGFFVAQQHC